MTIYFETRIFSIIVLRFFPPRSTFFENYDLHAQGMIHAFDFIISVISQKSKLTYTDLIFLILKPRVYLANLFKRKSKINM